MTADRIAYLESALMESDRRLTLGKASVALEEENAKLREALRDVDAADRWGTLAAHNVAMVKVRAALQPPLSPVDRAWAEGVAKEVAKPPPPEAAPDPSGELADKLSCEIDRLHDQLAAAHRTSEARLEQLTRYYNSFHTALAEAKAATERAEKAERERAFWQAQFDSVNLHIAQRVSEANEERDAALRALAAAKDQGG